MKTKRFSVITSLLIVVFLSLMTMTGALADRILYLDSSASITIPNTFKYSKKESGITFYSDSRSSIEMLYEALDFKLTLSQMKTVVSTNGFSNISVETNGNGVTYVLGHKLLSATQAEAVACFSSKNSTILLMIIYNPFKDSELTTTAKVLVSIKVASQTPSVPTPKPTATPTPTPTNNPLPAGWNQLNGNWYFVDNTGSYTVGWAKLNEKWYLFDNNGKMLTGWQQNNGNWYFFDGSGAMQTGWLQSGGVWYYLDSSGVMAKGWKEIQEGKTKTWYYFKADGAMVTDWQIIDGKWELFSSSGAWQYTWGDAEGNDSGSVIETVTEVPTAEATAAPTEEPAPEIIIGTDAYTPMGQPDSSWMKMNVCGNIYFYLPDRYKLDTYKTHISATFSSYWYNSSGFQFCNFFIH